MGDYSELKLLSEASLGEWYVTGELRYEDRRSGDLHGLHHDDERFIAAANPTAILELIAENDELRNDAKRYRWLRSRDSSEDPEISVTQWTQLEPNRATGKSPRLEVLDAAVDAAMSKEASHE